MTDSLKGKICAFSIKGGNLLVCSRRNLIPFLTSLSFYMTEIKGAQASINAVLRPGNLSLK